MWQPCTKIPTLCHRMCGPAYNVARQLAKCACWGGMLVSENVWKEQGKFARLWVYNQGVSMPWGPIMSCFTLLSEGWAAYTQIANVPASSTRGTPLSKADAISIYCACTLVKSMQLWEPGSSAKRLSVSFLISSLKSCLLHVPCAGVGMPKMPCHSTAWQLEGAKVLVAADASAIAPFKLFQSVRPQALQRVPQNPYAALAADLGPHASAQVGAGAQSSGFLEGDPKWVQPAANIACAPSSVNSVACLAAASVLPTCAHDGHLSSLPDPPYLQLCQMARQTPSFGTDSPEDSPILTQADHLRMFPSSGTSGSSGTTMESLDSASALQPCVPTFAQMLQQQNERAAQNQAALDNVGSSEKLSPSQMASALSALPKLSDTERMARFMAALQEARPRNGPMLSANSSASVPSRSNSQQLMEGLQESWGTRNVEPSTADGSPQSSNPLIVSSDGKSSARLALSLAAFKFCIEPVRIASMSQSKCANTIASLTLSPCDMPLLVCTNYMQACLILT